MERTQMFGCVYRTKEYTNEEEGYQEQLKEGNRSELLGKRVYRQSSVLLVTDTH